MGRVDLQVDGLSVYPLVVPCYARRLIFNFALDLLEVPEPSPRYMVEFRPLILRGDSCGCMRFRSFVVVWLVGRDVDELEDERSPGHYTGTPRQEVSPDDVL